MGILVKIVWKVNVSKGMCMAQNGNFGKNCLEGECVKRDVHGTKWEFW
jgi:hypothetical protein